jgi:hypothetical protein
LVNEYNKLPPEQRLAEAKKSGAGEIAEKAERLKHFISLFLP